jgi:NAD(P)-dependent dehydrogenase (short-subunit alcohol dehydrogenase family)
VTDRFRLDGQVALVNGASRGIGRAIAVGLAEAGASIALASRSVDGLSETAASIGTDARIIPSDLRDPSQARAMVHRTVEYFGRIDILVNAAGAALRSPAEQLDELQIAEIFASNFNGIAIACAEAGQHFIGQQSGRVINIASLASFRGVPGRALYGATKGAIAQLTRTLAVEWGQYGVCANAIAPGWIATDFTRDVLAQPEVRARVLDRTPLRRIGQPDDLVGLALFLASPASAFVTGQVICCDGGYSAT